MRKRLDTIPEQCENILITLFVDIVDNMKIESKSYGPLKVNILKLSMRDIYIYKFMVYKLLENNFTLLSAQ